MQFSLQPCYLILWLKPAVFVLNVVYTIIKNHFYFNITSFTLKFLKHEKLCIFF